MPTWVPPVSAVKSPSTTPARLVTPLTPVRSLPVLTVMTDWVAVGTGTAWGDTTPGSATAALLVGVDGVDGSAAVVVLVGVDGVDGSAAVVLVGVDGVDGSAAVVVLVGASLVEDPGGVGGVVAADDGGSVGLAVGLEVGEVSATAAAVDNGSSATASAMATATWGRRRSNDARVKIERFCPEPTDIASPQRHANARTPPSRAERSLPENVVQARREPLSQFHQEPHPSLARIRPE